MRWITLAQLICITISTPVNDLKRARTKVPRRAYRAEGSVNTAAILNGHLGKIFGNVKPCAEWTISELQNFQADLLSRRQDDLQKIYAATSDPRALHHNAVLDFQRRWSTLDDMAKNVDASTALAHRDGHCHETVMWLVHHLSSEDQRMISAEKKAVPSLPTQQNNCNSETHSELCKALVDQHSCLICHTTDEGAGGKDLPVPEPKPGHTDTFPVFQKRWIAKLSGWTYINQNGTYIVNGTEQNQSGEVSNQTYTMTYYYDQPRNRMRQDTVYNSSTPSRTGVTWFNGTTASWYIVSDYDIHIPIFNFNITIPLCIKLPPPIKTVQRPDFVIAAAARMGEKNGTYIGREQDQQGRPSDHWKASFYRTNVHGMHSNASFDIWLDVKTAHINKVIGKCDPPDAQEGSPTMAVANYDSFEEVGPEDSMDQYFDKDTKLMGKTRFCIPLTPHASVGLITSHGPGFPAASRPLEEIKEVKEALPRIIAEYQKAYLV